MTTTSQDLLELTVSALLGPNAGADEPTYVTNAGVRVWQPGDWPTQNDQYPLIRARLWNEVKTSLGRNSIVFLVVATIRLTLEVSEPVQLDNAGATAAERSLWALVRQCEVALINGYPLTSLLQQFPSITTQLSFNSEAATHLAGAQMDVAMEFMQSAEDFAPIAADDLTSCGMDVTNYPGPAGSFPLT